MQIDRLNMLTPSMPHLPFPHSSQIEGELRDLRCHYGPPYMLLHMFRKTTREVPEAEIAIARARGKTFRHA